MDRATVTENELRELLNGGNWTHEVGHYDSVEDADSDEEPDCYFRAWVTSSIALPSGHELEITWGECCYFSPKNPGDWWTNDDERSIEYQFSGEPLDYPIFLREDGKELPDDEVIKIIRENAPGAFSHIDFPEIISKLWPASDGYQATLH